MTTEKSPTDKPKRDRPNHARYAASIIKAAKAAGCATVTFADGTVVKLASDTVSVGSANEVDRWFEHHHAS